MTHTYTKQEERERERETDRKREGQIACHGDDGPQKHLCHIFSSLTHTTKHNDDDAMK